MPNQSAHTRSFIYTVHSKESNESFSPLTGWSFMKVITCSCWRQVDFACSLLRNSDGSSRSFSGCFLHFLAHVAILKNVGWCKPHWEIAHRACQRWESKDPSVQVLHVTKYLNCCVTDDFLPTECLQPEPCFLHLNICYEFLSRVVFGQSAY